MTFQMELLGEEQVVEYLTRAKATNFTQQGLLLYYVLLVNSNSNVDGMYFCNVITL